MIEFFISLAGAIPDGPRMLFSDCLVSGNDGEEGGVSGGLDNGRVSEDASSHLVLQQRSKRSSLLTLWPSETDQQPSFSSFQKKN